MAVEGKEAEEYESDPEDSIAPSAMRRREASDDEEEGGREVRRGRRERVDVGSDGESDDQGAAGGYEDEEEVDEEEEYEEELEEEEEEIGEEQGEEEEGRWGDEGDEKDLDRVAGKKEEDVEAEGERKENEPYAVPTAGAFYMHDDRFQDNGRGRHRRMPGGRRLWESKDDHTWVHDRFEEMNLQDSHYDQGRRSFRGRSRGRGGGRTRGGGRGFARGKNRPQGYYNDGSNQNREGAEHHRPQRTMRGRGPRRYETLHRNNEVSRPQRKQPAKPQEPNVNANAGRNSSQSQNEQPDPAPSKKHVFSSSLNSASPPFYPSGSSKQDTSITQKRDAQIGNANRTAAYSMQLENNFMSSQSGSVLRGKSVVDSVSHNRLYIDEHLPSGAGNPLANVQVQSSVPSLTSVNSSQFSQSRVQGKSSNINAPPIYQPGYSHGQVSRVAADIQPQVQQRPKTQFQQASRISTQQVGQQQPVSGSHVSCPPHALSTNSSEVGETGSPPASSKSKAQLVAKGKAGSQGVGRGSFPYGGQVITASGAIGLSQNDQNFPGTPALLPVMQFGGQHHGGLGVPAVGMAFPGYVAQPQLGLGNSEMTWVPVLAGAAGLGAAGALGASYPYIAIDGGYYPRPQGQSSSSVVSKETAKPASTVKPPQRPEIINEEPGQRQNKPRRYSEMNFGQ